MEISIPHPNLSIKIKASRTPFMSESGTAFFSIVVSYVHHYICNGRIPIIQDCRSREVVSFRFDRFLDWSQLLTVADKISSLSGIHDPVFFEEYFPHDISGLCNLATSIYDDRGVEFSVSVVLRGSAAPLVQASSYIDEVLVFDFDVQGRGNSRSSFNMAIEKLERIKDVSAVTSSSGHCAICLEEFGRGNDLDLGKTPCSHVFHYRCVRRWLERRQTCPLCRSDICG